MLFIFAHLQIYTRKVKKVKVKKRKESVNVKVE